MAAVYARVPAATPTARAKAPTLSNAEIAHHLRSLAQLLGAQGDNPFKIKAYRRAAETIEGLGESIADVVRRDGDLTAFAGIGPGIASAIREIVTSGQLQRLEKLRTEVAPEIAALSEFPRLDPKRVQQIYRKLKISSVAALREKLESGEIAARLGARLDQHVRRAMIPAHEILLFDADEIAAEMERYLRTHAGARRAQAAGGFRRRTETIGELNFVVVTDDFPALVAALERYGGHSALVAAEASRATLRLPNGLLLTVDNVAPQKWGLGLLVATGSDAHLDALQEAGLAVEQLGRSRKAFPTEAAVYRHGGLPLIPPELREGRDEIHQAQSGTLPRLVTIDDIRGELHAHTTASDGAATIEQMAEAARALGYEYLGITDHSQSLKIAGGVSEEALWKQIRRIDRLNAKGVGLRLLKSAEVDIRVDGTLDYPDELLRELDYTVCSIHSRFGLGKDAQTERILRAMDNPHFTILGHATGRLLLRRPGYELDLERVIAHARERGCFFEINASPDRLDLSAENARRVREAGIKIAICTDAHSRPELDYIRCGVDQARRAGLRRQDVLNCLEWPRLEKLLAK